MKYWIGITIISNKVTLLDTLETKIPSRLDTKLWDTDQYISARGETFEGDGYLSVSLYFETPLWRNDFKTLLGKLSDNVEHLLPGSSIKASKCWHDEVETGAGKLDELEYSEVIV